MSIAYRFNVAEYDRMIDHEVLDGRERRTELIQGEIREMTPPGPVHEDVVDLLAAWSFDQTNRNEVRIRVQNSVGLPELDSVPLPDVVWVRERSYRRGRPQVADVLLVIEVADSSLTFDRTVKAELYAAAGIADYWIVNIPEACLEILRQPGDGEYRERQTLRAGETASPLAAPDVTLEVKSLFEA